MEYRSHEIKAGVLVIVGFLVFIAFLVAMAKIDWERKEKSYTARFSYIGGIERGSLVRFGGFLVGTVTDVYIAPDDKTKLEIKLTVDDRTPVRIDSEAFMSSINLMGDFYIEITTGSPSAELLPPGSVLRSRDVPSFTQLSGPLAEMSDQLETLLIRVNDLLRDENRAHISNLLANTDTLLDKSAGNIASIIANMNTLTVQLQGLGGKLDKMMANNTSVLETTLTQLNATLTRADTLLLALNRATQSLDGMVTHNQAGFYEAMQNLQDATQHFEQFSRSIKERPWNLVRKSNPPERKLP
ncbi:MAG: MlaD family protein [candidate division KSB1 bacterium]|nr:MlaD family protein [candidate division KSB1 bacterium]MDZ7365627.1 MlaD family protein [candidate division KSB1 bacterium]MDZ7403297.1 MlaD family protein [candidate division KSB1 bacterium]